MQSADLNRALDKAESVSEVLLLGVVGLPKPWTFVAVLAWSLFCAFVGWWAR